MIPYLIKFTGCLAIFIVFYKLFLERENMHQIKRFFLLSALVLALVIPLITFTQYVEPVPTEIFSEPTQEFVMAAEVAETPQEVNYIPIILWTLYGFGMLIFGVKFVLNLYRIVNKIKLNPKCKNRPFINVLLEDLITPHTFFIYIFLNKQKFEAQEIPREVFIHEQTHAKQKHSIDVLFIELLQVVFWFNPLLYFIKKDIKLNHEFLADQAVLNNGIEPSAYQNLLLTFSLNDTQIEMANAFNYSSIKKRFKVMKKHTSKRNIWLRSIVILPLIVFSIYGFSDRKEVIKASEDLRESNSDYTARSINIEVLEDGTYIIDGITSNKSTLITEVNKLHQDITPEIRNDIMNIHVTSSSEISNEEVWFIYNSLLDYGFYRLVTPEQEVVKGKGNTPFAIEQAQQKATPEEVAEYNKLASQHNEKPENLRIIKQKDFERMEYLYKKMSKEQKANAEPFPSFPPPPPVPSQKTQNPPTQKEIDAYNTWAKKIHSESTTISGNATLLPIVDEQDLIKFSEIYNRMSLQQKNQSVKFPFPGLNVKENEHNSQLVPPPPPPPVPKSPLDHVIEMAKNGAMFFYQGKSISSDQAIELIKSNNKLHVSTFQKDSNQPVVHLTIEPVNSQPQTKSKEIVILNGKTSKDGSFVMSKDEFSNVELTIKEGLITNFNLKIPGNPTMSIKGNVLNNEAKALLKEMPNVDAVQLFIIKNSNNGVHPPILIKIK